MIDVEEAELLAARSAFCLVVARWRLTQAEVAALLGIGGGGWRTGVVLPDVLDASGETRLRLVVRLDSGLSPMFADDGDLADWLRAGTRAYDGATPLEAFADLAQLRAVVAVIEGRVDGDWPNAGPERW